MVDFTKSIRINLNLNQNELQDVVIQSLAAAPVAKKVGYIYFDSTEHKFGVCVDATAGAQKWEYMASAEALEIKLAEINKALDTIKTDLTVSKVKNATGIQQGDTKIYFDGLVTSVEAAEDNGIAEGVEGRKVGHFLKLTKTGAAGTPSEVSYIDMPETVTRGSLDNDNKKIVLTYSDNSTKDIDLAAIYDAIASKAVSVEATRTVELVSKTDPNTKAQTLSANVKLSGNENNAIKTVASEDGLLVEKVADLAAAEDAALGNLATGTAVVNALKNEKFAAATDKYGVIKLATNAEAIEGNDPNKAITAASLKAALQSNIVGAVTYSGTTTAITYPVKKGDLFLVDADTTLAEVALKKGDYILFNTAVENAEALTAAAFDVIDNTESEDIVRKDSEQTLTNKSIDAAKNTISNLKMTNLAAGNASFATTETTDEQKAAAKIASEAKVQEMVNAGVAGVVADEVTIEKNADGKFAVKEGGLEVKHMKADAVAGTIAAADTAVDTKLATEKAVRDLHNGIPAETMTLTNKTFDANGTGNSLSNVEVEDFAAGVIVKAKNGETGGIADVAAAADNKLATEKAIAEALAAIKASATVVKSVPLTFTMESGEAPESATATVELSSLGVDASHKVSMAKMLDDGKNEVEGLITYNQESGSVIFHINCTTAPTGWTALIIC